MKKALRVISIAMPFVVLMLLFVPFLVIVQGEGSMARRLTFSTFQCAQSWENILQSCTIAFFILALALSIASAILSRKHPVFVCLNAISAAYFWIIASVFKADYTVAFPLYLIKLHAAFYISLILSAFFLAVFIAYAVKWLKARLDSLPPREHKPTKAERIAELEARVRELENHEPENLD